MVRPLSSVRFVPNFHLCGCAVGNFHPSVMIVASVFPTVEGVARLPDKTVNAADVAAIDDILAPSGIGALTMQVGIPGTVHIYPN
jgi:hypothetical protein